LRLNGLTATGLAANAFKTWFDQDPASADMVMRYVAKCSMAAGAVSWAREGAERRTSRARGQRRMKPPEGSAAA
ncbi:hypothetical protein D7X32_37250, partial [Corallococcus carmarthensis]